MPIRNQLFLLFAAAAAGMVNACHMLDEVNELIGITPLIIIPSNELYKVVIECNTCVCIEDRSSGIRTEIH